jgi:molybdate transport system substrate-binding protein
MGEANASIVYVSDINNIRDIQGLEIPGPYNVTANYPIAMMLNSKNSKLVMDFIDFIQSPARQATLVKRGFSPAKQ